VVVNVTACPGADGLRLEVSVVVVGHRFSLALTYTGIDR
jgi:hypothetical protein